MIITRRALLRVMAVAATTAFISRTHALELPSGSVLVYDGLLPECRAFSARPAGHCIDLVDERSHQWRKLRALGTQRHIVGLTRWNDLVQVRAAVEPKGMRVRVESRCGRLYYWEMA